jgi:hypothetical protein
MNRKGSGRKRSRPNLSYYSGIRLEGLRKTTKKLHQHSRSPGPRFERRTSQSRSRNVNHSIPRRSVLAVGNISIAYKITLYAIFTQVTLVTDMQLQASTKEGCFIYPTKAPKCILQSMFTYLIVLMFHNTAFLTPNIIRRL